MKKGEIVKIQTRRGVIEEEIKSIGRKYITTKRHKFCVNTLTQIDPLGSPAYILTQERIQEREKMDKISFIKNFNFNKLTPEDILKIEDILDKYK